MCIINGRGLTYLVLSVDSIATTNLAGSRALRGTVVAPVTALLSVGTVASHVASITTDAADDVGGEVWLVGTVVLAVTNLTAVLAGLVLVVTESTVESSKLTELVALELVLSFGDRGSL